MLQLLSISHVTTSAKQRESLKWSVEEIELLREQLSLDGIVLIQTCNRIELIIDGSIASVAKIIDVWEISLLYYLAKAG